MFDIDWQGYQQLKQSGMEVVGIFILPPTLNLDNPDTSTKINLVPHNPIEYKTSNVISNSFGFGGTNASLIFGN